MKRLIISLLVILAIMFSINQSQAIPAHSLLWHQSWGGLAENIAVKSGINFDTAFVNAGTQVRVFQINHSSPNSPLELTGLNFDVSYQIRSIVTNSKKLINFSG